MAQSGTLARSTFAKLSPHEYLVANLQPSSPDTKASRTNGRLPQEARSLRINTGSLSHAHGSGIVRNGDTTVICGVRGEILPVSNIPNYRPRSSAELLDPSNEGLSESIGRTELKDYDLLVPNIELATGSAPQFLPGVPPTALAQTLSTRVYSLLHSCGLVGVDELRIWYTPPGAGPDKDSENEQMDEDNGDDRGDTDETELKAYWVLYIDLLFISYDGNPFDAAWAAVVAALKNTRLPQARWDPDRDTVVCSNKNRVALNLRGLPMASTAAVLMEKEHGDRGKNWVLLDPDRLEESLCDETLTVVLDCSLGQPTLHSISKSGGSVIGPRHVKQLVGVATTRWQEFRAVLDQTAHA